MNIDSESLDHRLLAWLQAVRDTHDEPARVTLNELLRKDATARAVMARLLVDEQVLIDRLREDRIASLLDPVPSIALPTVAYSSGRQGWRSLTAATAGLLLGMFCSSVVFGFVATRIGSVNKVAVAVYEPGMESAKTFVVKSVPHAVGQWGADSAKAVTEENGVKPLEGRRMMRLEPIPPTKDVKNHASRVYQVLDLRSLPMLGIEEDAELRVTASFHAPQSETVTRYRIRTVALSESPEQAVKDFWSKADDDGEVSVAQRFDVLPEDRGWHTFSLKMPLPQGARTLVIILMALPPEDGFKEGSVHYLDDVQVTVLTSPAERP